MLTESQHSVLIATYCIAVLVFTAFAGAYAGGSMAPAVFYFGSLAGIIAAVIAGGAAYIAARTAATISYSNKIAEFRQEWIIGLRSDITDYVAAAELWFRKWEELASKTDEEEKKRRKSDEEIKLRVAAITILNRIKLRLNPRENADKSDDDEFLKSLCNLLDAKINREEAALIWQKASNVVINQAREILKREWQKTKAVINPTRVNTK